MAKYVCSSETDTFMSTDADAAMAHLTANPAHKIVKIESNGGGGLFGGGEANVDTQVIEADENQQ